MKIIVTESIFVDQFQAIRPDAFSYDALEALFSYYEEHDTEMELDVIAICCEWNEYQSIEEMLNDYNYDTYEELDASTYIIKVHESCYLMMDF